MLRYPTRIALVLAVPLVTTFSLSGCDNDDAVGSQHSITDDEAAVIVANAFGSGSFTYGLTGQIEELAGIANGGTLQKGSGTQQTTLDTVTITRSKTGVYSYNYTFHFSYGLVGSQLDVSCDMRGTYDTPDMASRDTAHASLEFTNLSSDILLVRGYSWRFGHQNSKAAERKSFTSDIVATFDDISVNRTARIVIGGTVSLTMRERFPDDFLVSLPGTFTYLNNHQAVLVINRKAYKVNLDTAKITAD
jgi:hypothetical protein